MSNLPDGWRLSVLSDIAIEQGLQTGPFGSQLKASEYSENGIPVVMPSDLADYRISTDSIARIPVERARDMGKHQLQTGDIIFGRRGDIGRCAMVTENEEGWICGTGCLRVRLSLKKALPEFVIQYLDLTQAIGWLQSNAVGQTMLNLNTTILSELPLYLPPLAEQRKIAEILSTWDEAIQLVEALIAALKERKRGLMQRLLTGEVRFPGFDGEWEEVQLGDVASMRSGGTPSTQIEEYWDGTIPWITGADFDEENLRLGQVRRYINDEAVQNSSTTVIPKGDILLVSRTGVGKMSIAPFDVAVSQDITGLATDNVNMDYLLFSLFWNVPRLTQFNQGTSISGVTRSDLKNLTIQVPSVQEQQKIAVVLGDGQLEVDNLTQFAAQLREQKKGLMQRLLTGEVRVDVSDDV